jgi:hypothetical protein
MPHKGIRYGVDVAVPKGAGRVAVVPSVGMPIRVHFKNVG